MKLKAVLTQFNDTSETYDNPSTRLKSASLTLVTDGEFPDDLAIRLGQSVTLEFDDDIPKAKVVYRVSPPTKLMDG